MYHELNKESSKIFVSLFFFTLPPRSFDAFGPKPVPPGGWVRDQPIGISAKKG
jgi:hypothetical protein